MVFRYAEGTNPNGSINDIAGIINASGNVLGLMPHPENLIEAAHGGTDGRAAVRKRARHGRAGSLKHQFPFADLPVHHVAASCAIREAS